MEPRPERLVWVQPGDGFEEEEERRLERIFGVVTISEYAAANSVDERAVARDQRFKCRVGAAVQEAIEEFTVGYRLVA